VLTGLLFALCGMVLNSVAGLLQSDAARRASRHHRLLTQRRYLAGLVVDGLGWICTVVALRHLPVFAVQGVLGGSIAVTAILARALYGSTLRTIDRTAIGACLLGLVLITGSAGTEQPSPASVTAYVVLFVAAAVLAAVMVVLWKGSAAWPLAMIAGLGFGGTSLAVRAVHVQAGHGFELVELVTQPVTYLLLVMWTIGMTSYTRALGLGSLARVTAVFQVTEVIVPGMVGIVLLGDSVRAGWQIPMVAGLAMAAAGVVVLARSPAHQPRQPARPAEGPAI
jgi:drug/metabolite transporter (DMT)-like permease